MLATKMTRLYPSLPTSDRYGNRHPPWNLHVSRGTDSALIEHRTENVHQDAGKQEAVESNVGSIQLAKVEHSQSHLLQPHNKAVVFFYFQSIEHKISAIHQDRLFSATKTGRERTAKLPSRIQQTTQLKAQTSH